MEEYNFLKQLADELECRIRDAATGEPLNDDALVELYHYEARPLIDYLRQCAEQRPVAYKHTESDGGMTYFVADEAPCEKCVPLYAAPVPPQREPLSDSRPCTCHPDDNPPVPCAQKYALNECRAASEPTETEIEARDALLDFISENGTASEGVQYYLDRYVRAALAAKGEGMSDTVEELRDVLLRNGFVPCDIPACNCGSWHARFGLRERFEEIKDDLDAAGHPPSNANGNSPRGALRDLIADRDRLRAAVEALAETVQAERASCVLDLHQIETSNWTATELESRIDRLGAALRLADAALTEGKK